jgi:8-oxo-dGTP diphosphatase
MIKGVDYIAVSVVPFLHDGKGNYLVGLRSDKCRDEQGAWEPLGSGSLEFGELIEAALVREVREETGATPFNFEYLGLREVHREHDGQKTHWLAFDYRAEVNREEVTIMEPDKCVEIRWCKVDEIPEPRHSQFPIFLERYETKL